MPIGDLFGLIQQKKQTSTDKYLASSVNIVSTGEKGQLRPPFSQQRGINSFHSWIYAAAQINANAVASVPIRLYKQADSNTRQKGRPVSRRTKSYLMGDGPGDQRPSMSVLRKAAELGDDVEEVTGSNPVIDLLQNANPFLNGFDLAVLRVLYGELTGNSYLHPIIDPETDQPSELWPLAPQYVEVIPCEDNFIEGYVYGIDAQRKQVFEPDEVIHFRRPNPGNYYYGMGKVEAAFGAVLSNDAVHQMDLSTFANSARPDYAVVVKGTPTGDQLDRFQQQVEERLKGTRKDGNFIAVSGDVQFTPLNFPPKDVAGREEIVEEIAAIFGVPVTMMKANDPNLASAKSGFSQWREGTILPLCRMDEQELNQSLLPMFGLEDDYFLAYDNPVPKDEAFDLQARQSAVAGGWQTPNEARMEEGRDAIEDPMADSLLYSGQPLGGPQMPGGGGIMPPMGQAMPGVPGEPGEAQAEPGENPGGDQAIPGPGQGSGQGPGQGGQAALNGAQISSVITILDGVASGTIAKEGAVELIMATGVTKESAQRMVSTQATAKPEAQAEAELDANIGPTTPEEKSKIDLATVADVGFLLKQGIISRHVAVKAFQAAGMTRKRAERVSKSEATKANVLRSDDDIYDTCDEAKRIAEGIGCQGCHEHDVGGTTKWMPCSSMEEYEKVATVLESVEKGGGVSGLIPKLLGARMSAAARTALGNNILEKADDCGTGSGGFKPGNDCAEGHGRPEGSDATKPEQVETPEFKDWFGESKVANWDGTPKVQYHGTQAGEDFSAFRAPKDSDPVSSALFVAPRTWIAEQYAGGEEGTDKFPKNARLIPVYASIQKPYMVGGIDQGITIGELRAEGYDGIVDAAGGYWAAFDPSQLKSSIGNDGSFDADNPDLTKSAKDCGTGAGGFKPSNDCAEGHGRPEGSKEKPKTETPEFEQWFGDSVEKDDGKPRVMYHGTAGPHNEFSPGITWVSEDEEHADMYANAAESMTGEVGGVIPLYVRSERPVHVRNRPKEVKLDTLANEILASAREDGNKFNIKEAKNALDNLRSGWRDSGVDTGQAKARHEWWFDPGRESSNEKNFARLVQAVGYDSVEYYETIGGYRGSPEVVVRTVGVFDSNQLKSSKDNDGEFSRDSEDITKAADNCGTGAGGFQPGNDCAEGHGEQSADGVNQEKKDEDLSIDDRLDAHLRNSGSIANFAERLANGELNADDFHDLNGYLSEQMDAAYDAGDNDEGGDWEQHQNDLTDEMFTRGLLDDNFEPVNIPSKSEPWPEKRRDVPDFTKIPEATEARSRHLANTFLMKNIGDEDNMVDFRTFVKDHNLELELQGRKATVHIDSKDLREVLFDGGFLPFGHPDVPRSTNANTSHREHIERRMGLEGSEWHERPVYAAFSSNDWEDFEGGHGSAGSFGNVEVVLKDSVLSRSTVTFGDSGERMEDPDYPKFDSPESTNAYPVPIAYDRIMSGKYSEDEAHAAHSTNYIYSQMTQGNDTDSWTEAQIWGGVTVDDIESVRVSPAAIEEDRKTGGRLSQMLTEAGIEIEVAEGDWKGEY